MSLRHIGSAGAASLLAIALSACVSTKPSKPDTNEQASAYNLQLGIAYMEQNNLPTAKDKLERAVKENPRDPNVHNALAFLYERLGQPEQTDKEYRTALHLDPENPEIANNYAAYLCRSNRADEGARRLLEVAKNPLYRTPEAAYTNAGVCLRALHRDDEAERNIQHALDIRPSFAEAVFQLGDLELQRGHLKEARARVDAYLGTYPATPELLLLGVRIARASGDRVTAERYSRRLRLDFPDSQQVRALSEGSPNPG
jgi:type IV pilus assembly protein PilF